MCYPELVKNIGDAVWVLANHGAVICNDGDRDGKIFGELSNVFAMFYWVANS